MDDDPVASAATCVLWDTVAIMYTVCLSIEFCAHFICDSQNNVDMRRCTIHNAKNKHNFFSITSALSAVVYN